MIRIVLAGETETQWRIYRQPQWMAHVRQSPEASQWLRHHLDIEESAYQEAIAQWSITDANRNEGDALALLSRLGAVEIRRV